MLQTAPLPPDPPAVPSAKAPPGSCDCHVHILAAHEEFPLWEGRAENPGEGSLDTWLARLSRMHDALGIERTVLVHSIFYGIDPALTETAIAALGRDRCRGVGLVADDVDDETLDRFVRAGIVAVRLNATLARGVMTFEGLKAMAPRLADRGLHAQILAQTGPTLSALADDLKALPVPVVLDHIGWPDPGKGVDDPGFQVLLRLVGEGAVSVKLSAPYRMADAPYTALDPFVRALVAANPEACLWGSDWPHIMLAGAQMPSAAALYEAFRRCVPDDAVAHRILVTNPERVYGFTPKATTDVPTAAKTL